MLRNQRFARPHHGVRTVIHSENDAAHGIADLAKERARGYLPLLRPHEAFSHTTALILMGAPLRVPLDLHVAIPRPHRAARGRNVIGHTSALPFGVDDRISDFPCVPAELALAQSGGLLSFRELVVAIDHLVCPRPAHGARASFSTLRDIETALRAYSGHGIGRARAALSVARVGAESRMESSLHFELARMGIDTLELQADVHDNQGRWIGRFDQVDRVKRRILEYDGEQHRTDRNQYLKDIERLERARDAGYRILRLQKEHFHVRRLQATRELLCEFLEVDPRPLPRALARCFAEE